MRDDHHHSDTAAASRVLGTRLGLFQYPTHKSGAYIMRTDRNAQPLTANPTRFAHHRTSLMQATSARARNAYTVDTRVFRAHRNDDVAMGEQPLQDMPSVEIEISV